MRSISKPLKQLAMADNQTSSFAQLPINALETFIPGFGLVSRFFLESLGFDITFLVYAALILFGIGTVIKFVWKYAQENVRRFLMSSVRIEYHDDIYDHVMEWVAFHKSAKGSRNLLVKTGHENHWEIDEGSELEGEDTQEEGLLNFSNWDSKRPPKFEPSYGVHQFFHRGNWFFYSRDQKMLMDSSWGYATMRDDEYVTLSCLGRSPQPVKDLIREARDFYLQKKSACTTVRRPAAKQTRNGRGGSWMRAAVRPSRPMDTVVLDHALKKRVLEDINEYLHPSAARWYSHRGIPYRRGYLLHGPPGTGKSSLAWAIAGVFGIDIYCISLVDPNLTEEELGMLFTSLPRRCVVLLEDIDSAGLVRRQESEAKTKTEGGERANIGAEIAEQLIETVQKKSDKEKQGISLSGLLNAIDGVASHEGRVLIMTSNFPEQLDDALTRPGRIDMKVPFTLASREQIRELFSRMYSPDVEARGSMATQMAGPLHDRDGFLSEKAKAVKTVDISTLTPPDTPEVPGTPKRPDSTSNHSAELGISELADRFASTIPSDTFTPAEIQGFLLTRKKEPAKAVEQAAGWRDEHLAATEKKKARLEQSASKKE